MQDNVGFFASSIQNYEPQNCYHSMQSHILFTHILAVLGAWPENILTTLGHNLNYQNVKKKKIPHRELNFTMPGMINLMNKHSLNGLILPVLDINLVNLFLVTRGLSCNSWLYKHLELCQP